MVAQRDRQSDKREEEKESSSEAKQKDGAARDNTANLDNSRTKDAAIIRRASTFKAQNASRQSCRGSGIEEKSVGNAWRWMMCKTKTGDLYWVNTGNIPAARWDGYPRARAFIAGFV